MRKILSFAIAASALIATQASAITYWDFDFLPGDEGLVINPGENFSDEFNISVSDGSALVGFNPGTQMITSATAAFGFLGLGTYVIEFDSQLFSDSGVFIAKLDLGDVTGDAFITLSNTGSLNYSVTNDGRWGAFNLTFAKLWADAEYKAVPDSGSTLALLGLALLGLLGLRRRSAS